MAGINFNTGGVVMNWDNPPNPDKPILTSYGVTEPDAIEHLAAIADPDGEAAKRVAAWKKSQELLKTMTKASDEIYKRTVRNKSNWVKASPQFMQLMQSEIDAEGG